MPDNDGGITKTGDASSSTTERRVLFDAARGNNEDDGLLEGTLKFSAYFNYHILTAYKI